MSTSGLHILVVEDDAFTRTLVSGALRNAGFTVVDAGSVREALEAASLQDFHLVVSDLDLGHGPSGADLLARIREDQPWMATVVLTTHATPELASGPLTALPADTVYLVKTEMRDVDLLVDAIDRALSGTTVTPPLLKAEDRTLVTPGQGEVLRMLAAGFTTSAIADRRSTSVRAAEMLVRRLYEKLGVAQAGERDPRTVAVQLWQQGRVRVS